MEGKEKIKHNIDLKLIKEVLEEIRITSELIVEPENDITTLYFLFPISLHDIELKVFMSFMPLAEDQLHHTKLLQIFTEISQFQDDSQAEQISVLIDELNMDILFGRLLAIQSKIAFRYVLTLPQYFEFNKDFLLEFLEMLNFNLDYSANKLNDNGLLSTIE